MPTIRRVGPYRVYFFSNEAHEPPHVHVDRDEYSAKFWLAPLGLAHNLGFGAVEIRQVFRLLEALESDLLEAWHDHFA